jgi:hypothetical protein
MLDAADWGGIEALARDAASLRIRQTQKDV